MSYLLDALKKNEHEKLKKSRGTGMSSITDELFSSDQRPDSPGGMWRALLVIAVIVALATFGATWFFLKPEKGRTVPKPSARSSAPDATLPSPVIPSPPPVSVVPQPPVTPPVAASGTAASRTAAALPAPQPQVRPVPKATVAPPAPPARTIEQQRSVAVKAPAAKPSAQSVEDSAALITIQELRKRMKEQKPPSVAPPADIKLSGIAWQEDRRARRAVVNGFLTQEGAVISGARITEILQDRVRFSQAGGVFEISLASSAGMAPAGK